MERLILRSLHVVDADRVDITLVGDDDTPVTYKFTARGDDVVCISGDPVFNRAYRRIPGPCAQLTWPEQLAAVARAGYLQPLPAGDTLARLHADVPHVLVERRPAVARRRFWSAVRRAVIRSGRWLALALVAIALGLGLHVVGHGPLAAGGADVVYAVMMYALLGAGSAAASPLLRSGAARLIARPPILGATAFVLCSVIELAQLSAIPAVLAVSVPPIGLVLGYEFSVGDLLLYLWGAAAALTFHACWRRWAAR